MPESRVHQRDIEKQEFIPAYQMLKNQFKLSQYRLLV